MCQGWLNPAGRCHLEIFVLFTIFFLYTLTNACIHAMSEVGFWLLPTSPIPVMHAKNETKNGKIDFPPFLLRLGRFFGRSCSFSTFSRMLLTSRLRGESLYWANPGRSTDVAGLDERNAPQ